jgi:hypothetical protein
VIREDFLEEVVPEMSLKIMRPKHKIPLEEQSICLHERTLAEKPGSVGQWEEIFLEAFLSQAGFLEVCIPILSLREVCHNSESFCPPSTHTNTAQGIKFLLDRSTSRVKS